MPTSFKKVFLIILDGFGLAGKEPGNAILKKNTPYLDSLIAQYPAMSIAAAGLVVGLPWGQPGNSEVGHSALGTGRIVIQDLAHINGEIRSGDFYKNPALVEAVEHAKKHDSALHLMGCTSPGGIHSHLDHLIALLELAHRHKLEKIFIHFIADGQDMPPQDAIHVLETLKPFLKKSGARIASIQGRSYAMDRVLNWKLTERVWHAVVVGDAPAITDPADYLKEAYKKKFTDYSLEPATVVDEQGAPIGAVQDHDAFIFFDFRNDRVKQMATPFIMGNDFKEFTMVKNLKNLKVVTMTKYAEEFKVPTAYTAPELPNTLGEVISKKRAGQWRIAEKEKEAHVTNFFNGGRIKPFAGEERLIVSSRMMKGEEYLEHPEMSAGKIVDAVLDHATDDSRLYVINFANPDMIGHTGNFKATVEAIEITDQCLKKLISPLLKREDTAIIITADHGNAEELLDPLTGGEDTQHSTRNVPAVFIAPSLAQKEDTGKTLESLAQEAPIGTLVDIAPSVLHLLGIEKPDEMTGSRLVSIE
jgi:2,3-bisphosphoglycerate-independent phosphoglycerate mutase